MTLQKREHVAVIELSHCDLQRDGSAAKSRAPLRRVGCARRSGRAEKQAQPTEYARMHQARDTELGPEEVAQYMSENLDLLEAAHDRICLGRLHESLEYSMLLQQNLTFLAMQADEDPDLQPIHIMAAQPEQPQPAQLTNAEPDERDEPLDESAAIIEDMARRRRARAGQE